jgi:hypothetical protein
LRCRFRHEDNGNCTAVGGFCTAVAAAHCPLLREYLDTGMTPEEILPKDKADEIALKLMRLADLESLCSYTRLRELAEADKNGRVVVLPRWKNKEERLERQRLMRIMADGEVYTGYYNADATDKAVIAHNIQADITMDIIRTNAAIIKDMIEHCEEDE